MDASIVETTKQDALFKLSRQPVLSATVSPLGRIGFGGPFGVSGWECTGGLSEFAGVSGDPGGINRKGYRKSYLKSDTAALSERAADLLVPKVGMSGSGLSSLQSG